MSYAFLITALILNSIANIMMKLGAMHLGDLSNINAQEMIYKFITNWRLILGLFFFAVNVILYVIALNKLDISMAYPIMTTGGFLIISVFSVIFLKEPFTLIQGIGIILATTGITLIAYRG